jgi:hypothetical protein
MVGFFYAYSTVFYLMIGFMTICFAFAWLRGFLNEIFNGGHRLFFMFGIGITFLFLFVKQADMLNNINFLFDYDRLIEFRD